MRQAVLVALSVCFVFASATGYAGDCHVVASTCVDNTPVKNVSGVDINVSQVGGCWEFEDTYECIGPTTTDYCAALDATAGCAVSSAVCSETAFNGTCLTYTKTYRCGNEISPPAGAVKLDNSYTIVSDKIDNSECQDLDNSPNCTLASNTCIEGPATKNINGLDVYKDCWEWKKDYTCASEALTSTCAELQNNELCLEIGSSCVDTLPSGACGLRERVYKCSVAEATTSTETDCGLQTFCIEGKCFDTGYAPDKDFGNVIANMEAVREAASYDIFKGEANFCHAYLAKNCCKSEGGGQNGRNDQIANQVGAAAFKVGGEVIKHYGSQYVFEGLVNLGDAFANSVLSEYGWSALSAGAFESMSVWGAKFSFDAAGSLVVGFDPWSLAISVAIYVIMDMMSCEIEDHETNMKRGQALCHKVGSYCSKKVLKACVEKTEGWCCFPSKLGRIINEQGRTQIGKSWGDAENPDCSGFTMDELGQLDFSTMNLAEFIADIVPSAKSTTYAVDRLTEKATSYYGTYTNQ